MLIDSPRLTTRDRAEWERLETYDQALSRDPRLEVLTERARTVAADFGPAWVGTSWGKDSMVVLHLTRDLRLPVVWMRTRDLENPDCFTVRDAYLNTYPDTDYHEITTDAHAPRWWETEDAAPVADARPSGIPETHRRFGPRYISGIRADESTTRRRSVAKWGTASPNACRPIAHWAGTDVFAYLHKHDLPVHPAYAMSAGGYYDRARLRVATLGGIRGAARGRSEWEARYYGDILQKAGLA